jgi:hypothetical protein
MRETRRAPIGPDGCTHSDSLKWYAWLARDPSQPGGQCFCIGCMVCGTVLAGIREGGEHGADA